MSSKNQGALLAVLTLFFVGCSTEDSPTTLAGTQWRLVEIQSMDDAQGTTKTPDPGKFTVDFGADGRAAFQIDCNRGNGSWEATPSGEDASGTLIFGPIATTKMMCPQPSLDQSVAKALSNVRSYLIKDRQLHLPLLADGGILTWEPK
jgi:heat shock protein HslJ